MNSIQMNGVSLELCPRFRKPIVQNIRTLYNSFMPTLQTIRQAGKVLELFTRQDPEWGVREVARNLEIPKSNAHQLLASLETIGLLHRMVTGRYRLGFRLLTLGQFLLANTPWRDVAHRVLVQVSTDLSETVQLAVLDGGNLIYVDKILGSNPHAVVSRHSDIGNAVSPHSSALGRVLLASKTWRVVQGTLGPNGLQERTSHTITDLSQFKSELEQVSNQGFALEFEESSLGITCVAAPIRNHNGDVIAAISSSIHSDRTTGIPASVQDRVIQTATLISRSIAFDPEFVIDNRTRTRLAGRNS
jgi:IclR family transcriptional regulator, KDG regulon repressor